MQPQTIRRKVDRETYEDLASGLRPFAVCLPDEDVQAGDWFVFVEMVGDQPNREIYRKVSLVAEADDLVIAGLVPAEYQSLEGIFAHNGAIIAYAIDKRGDEIRVIDGPAFIPLLMTPYVDPYQINSLLNVQLWPSAQYSILVKCRYSDQVGRQDIETEDVVVLCCTVRRTDDEELTIFQEVDQRFLLVGSLKDKFGNALEPYFIEPEDKDELSGDQEAAVDRIVALTEQDSA